MRYWLVMPAAGAGRRFGAAKQYASVGERTVLESALQPFLADEQCVGGSVVLAATDAHREQIAQRLPAHLAVVTGGSERVHSVQRGLQALQSRAGADDWVLVHDAARPCLTAADLARLLQLGAADPVGALLAVPVADSVKRAQPPAAACGAVRWLESVSRESLWLAQTPQMFRYAALCTALASAIDAGRTPTDEAQAMEWSGQAGLLVPALDSNLKVTGAADLLLARAILAARGGQEA
jgi:2-C-methyl-D-erythritol 4-phosphate cytidylyltransferase